MWTPLPTGARRVCLTCLPNCGSVRSTRLDVFHRNETMRPHLCSARLTWLWARRITGLFAFVAAHLLSAQTRPVASPGALVRITHTAACCSNPIVGTLVSIEPDSLRLVDPFRLQASKPRAVLPRTAVVSIDVGRRVGAHKANGAALGLLIGVLAGAVIGSQGTTHEFRSLGAFLGGAGGGVLGLVVGTVVGATMPNYEWTPAQLPPQRP
jgi:hypothetical protein